MSIVVQTLHFGGHELLNFRAGVKNREVTPTRYPSRTATRLVPPLEGSNGHPKKRSGGVPIKNTLRGHFRLLSFSINFQIGPHISLVVSSLD